MCPSEFQLQVSERIPPGNASLARQNTTVRCCVIQACIHVRIHACVIWAHRQTRLKSTHEAPKTLRQEPEMNWFETSPRNNRVSRESPFYSSFVYTWTLTTMASNVQNSVCLAVEYPTTNRIIFTRSIKRRKT